MLLRKLSVSNVGPFKSEQSIDFSIDESRPITLIGGENGCGKTTLLESLLLVLYGKRARKLLGFTSYSDFLKEITNRDCNEAFIVLEFERVEGQDEQFFTISRSWESSGDKPPKETFEVTINKEPRPDLASNWPEYIEQILPESMAGLFIFDGERIEKLAEAETSAEALRASIFGLLGLDLVERLQTDLVEFRQEALKDIGASSKDKQGDERLRNAEVSLDSAGDLLASAEVGLEESLLALTQAETELSAAGDAFSKSGGDLYDQRERLTSEKAMAEGRCEAVRKEAHQLAAGKLPLQIASKLLLRVENIGIAAKNLRDSEILLRSHQERDDHLMRLFSEQSSLASEHLTLIDQILSNQRQVFELPSAPPFDFENDILQEVQRLLGTNGESDGQALKEACDEIEESAINLKSVQQSLASVPGGKEISAVIKRVHKAEHEVSSAKSDVEKSRDELFRANTALERCQREFEISATVILESDAATSRSVRIDREVKKASETLKNFQTCITSRNLDQICHNVLTSLKILYRKKSLVERIEINPETLEVKLFNISGAVVNPTRLSAGERQLLATAFLWGISKSTGRKLPSVVDTPLARLDRSHRSHFVERYFPVVSHQVILLSTDEEIVGKYHESLKPSIGVEYLLTFNEEHDQTFIETGYFA
jgi:DNA sulfur modification protein DndD